MITTYATRKDHHRPATTAIRAAIAKRRKPVTTARPCWFPPPGECNQYVLAAAARYYRAHGFTVLAGAYERALGIGHAE